MHRFLRKTLVASLALSAGCTFTGLGRYDVTYCNAPKVPGSFAEDPCASLNEKETGCTRYQCEALTGRCVLRALDFDRDGDPEIACGGHDCDDHDGQKASSLAETCDAIDNDCDGTRDEGLIGIVNTESLLSLPANFRDASLSSANGKDIVGAAVVDNTQGSCILAFRGSGEALSPPCTFPPINELTPHQPVVRPIAAEDVTFGVAFIAAPTDCPAGQLAYRSSKGGYVKSPCAAGGVSLPSFLPYPGGKTAIIASVRRDVTSHVECASAEPAPLDLAWIEQPASTSTGPQPRIYSQRLSLALSLAASPPALVPWKDAVFLAAPSEGGVSVWALRAPRPDGSGESVVPLLTTRTLKAFEDAREVDLAVALSAPVARLAIAAEVGCGQARRAVLGIVELTEPGPVLNLTRVVDVASSAVDASAPQITWVEARQEWWLSWLEGAASGRSVHVSSFNADGIPTGTELTLTKDDVVQARPSADTPGIESIDARGLAHTSIGCH